MKNTGNRLSKLTSVKLKWYTIAEFIIYVNVLLSETIEIEVELELVIY